MKIQNTNMAFHAKMNDIMGADSYGYQVFGRKSSLTAKDIVNLFVHEFDYEFMSDATVEQYETLNTIYFEKISNTFGYEFAKDAFNYEDSIIDGIIVPFYMTHITSGFSAEVISEDTILILSHLNNKVMKDDKGVLRFSEYCTEYTCLFKDGVVQSYISKEIESPSQDILKKYSVSYEHFSSSCVDVGSSKKVLAKNVEDAIIICSMDTSPPDDYLSWSFEVYSLEDDEHYSDESSCSYLNAIERPGIAKCEAEERKKQEALVPLSQDNGTSSNLELDLAF